MHQNVDLGGQMTQFAIVTMSAHHSIFVGTSRKLMQHPTPKSVYRCTANLSVKSLDGSS